MFLESITPELIDTIVHKTNLHHSNYLLFRTQILRRSFLYDWKDIDDSDILAFIGILLLAGINKRTSIYDHFSLNPLLHSPVAD